MCNDDINNYSKLLKLTAPEMTGEDVPAAQRMLIQAGFSHLQERVTGKFAADTQKAVIAFQASVGMACTGELDQYGWEVLCRHTDPGADWIAAAAGHAVRILELEGKRLVFRDGRVKEEVVLASRRKPVPHPCESSGCYLHPELLRMIHECAAVNAVEVGWLRATHGKYKKTAGDTSVCKSEAPVSAHFIGMGVDFYKCGPDLAALKDYEADAEGYYSAIEPLIAALYSGKISCPPHWWVFMPPELNKRYSGLLRQVQFNANQIHINHLHIGLAM